METGKGDLRAPGLTEEDTMMMDMGGKRQPLGDPPDVTESWAQKVAGGRSGGRHRPESVLDAAFVEERMQLEFPDGADGEPVITIGSEVLEVMNGLWKQCIIVKVLGKKIAIPALARRLKEMWKPKGEMTVLDLPRHFFMVRFELEEEYLNALTGGPWRVFGSYLMVKGWSPDFDPTRDEIVTTPVWVRLLNIPVNLYHQTILFGIARGLGKPAKVDLTTLNCDRARFARVCVEVNLSKPLKGTILINGTRYFVEYEGLPMICSGCGIYGHLIHKCPKNVVPRAAEPVVENTVAMVQSGAQAAGKEVEPRDEGFKVVRRQGRRGNSPGITTLNKESGSGKDLTKNLNEISGVVIRESLGDTNRFATLDEDMISSESQEVVNVVGADKDNEYPPVLGDTESSERAVVSLFRFTGSGKNRNGLGNGPKDVRAEGVTKGFVHKPKPKNNKTSKSTRGLVFGPLYREDTRSESGKRLRVEEIQTGRAGGVFTSLNNVQGQQTSDEVVGSLTDQTMERLSVASDELPEKTRA